MLNKLERWLLPSQCLLCSTHKQVTNNLCRPCIKDLPWQAHTCQQCGLPLPITQPHCGNCLKANFAFDDVVSAMIYKPPIQGLMIKFKFQQGFACGKALSHLLLSQLQSQQTIKPDYLIAMPSHWKRKCKRGFNQAHEIAKVLSKELHLPLLKKGIIRCKHTPPQAQLGSNARSQNLRHAFKVPPLNATHVAIIDDVLTSGNTANALAKTLKNANVSRVSVWVAARATNH
jgi:ComF family protein